MTETHHYARLWHRSSSEQSIRLSQDVLSGIYKRKANDRLIALGAILAELFQAEAKGAGTYCFRPMHAGAFSGRSIGYKPFIAVLELLLENDFIEDIPHSYCLSKRSGQSRQWRGKSNLFEAAAEYGIHPGNWEEHFERIPNPYAAEPPVVLKASKPKHFNMETLQSEKSAGKRLKVDFNDPVVMALAKQVIDINEFTATQTIEGADHFVFQRIFNEGDREGHSFCRGGRLYSLDGYHAMSGKERAGIKINGEQVVELDIKASFLTIYYALRSTPLSGPDPYDGIDPALPRDVAKAWVNTAFGCKGFPSKWSDTTVKKLLGKKGIDLTEYHVRDVSKAVRSKLVLMKDWKSQTGISWGVLQYRESNAVIKCVHTLATKHNVLALPVHDSIIVQKQHEELARKTLSDCFYAELGVYPSIEAK